MLPVSAPRKNPGGRPAAFSICRHWNHRLQHSAFLVCDDRPAACLSFQRTIPKSSSPGKISAWHEPYSAAKTESSTQPRNSTFEPALRSSRLRKGRFSDNLQRKSHFVKRANGDVDSLIRHQSRDDQIVGFLSTARAEFLRSTGGWITVACRP